MQVRSDRVFLRYKGKTKGAWELIEKRISEKGEEEKVLAVFLTGSKREAGSLARWVLEHVQITGKA